MNREDLQAEKIIKPAGVKPVQKWIGFFMLGGSRLREFFVKYELIIVAILATIIALVILWCI